MEQANADVQSTKEQPFTTQTIATGKPILVFVDDDGRSETWTKTREIFNRKGKKFVSAVTTNNVGQTGYMTLDQVKQLVSEGHEISSHHTTHVMITDELLPQIGQSKQWFKSQNITCETLTWVGGAYSNNAIAEAKKFYKAALSVEKGKNSSPVKQFRLNRYSVGSIFGNSSVEGILEDGSQTQYNAMVDLAKNNNALVIAMMHNWHTEFTSEQQTRLEAMIDYADTQGVEIMTISEALKYFGNIIDIGTDAAGYFRVGSDGSVQDTKLLSKLVYKNIGFNPQVTNLTTGTAFEKGFVSVASFNGASNSGFPDVHAGTLETYYMNDQYTIFQKWYPYDLNTIWYRQWHYSTGWKEWRRASFDTKPATDWISVAAQTVNANSVLELRLDHPNPTDISGQNDLVIMSPKGGLETGLIYNVSMWTDKKIILRLFNPTASAITTALRDWRIKILK